MGPADTAGRTTGNYNGNHLGKSSPPNGNAQHVAAVATESPRSIPRSTIGSSACESLGRNFTHLKDDDIPPSGAFTHHDTIPKTPHGCPRHLAPDSSGGQDLGVVDATKPGAIASDGTQTATSISPSQSALASSTSARTAQPLIVALPEAVEVPSLGGDAPQSAAPSRCGSIPGTRNASSERQLSPEAPQGQSPATIGCESGDVEAQAHEAAFGLSFGTAEAPSPAQGPITLRRSHRIAAHRLTHNHDGGDNNADRGPQGLPDEDEHCPRKRRRVSSHAAASIQRPHPGKPSLRSTAQPAKKGTCSRASGILSPASQGTSTSNETELGAVLARFEEWPVENASLKRITENGKATFQLQFNWTPHTKHGHAGSTGWDSADSPSTRTMRRAKRASATRTPYTTAEDNLLLQLKERETLAWPEIYQRFNATYPGRSAQSLQVHYSTKLKGRERL